MSLLEIKLYPDPILRKKATPVEEVNDEIRTLLDNMAETMYDAPGVGLAGPQVGVAKRLLVIDINPMLEKPEEGPGLLKVINPQLEESDGKSSFEEGCLSLPGLLQSVDRPETIKVSYTNEEGQRLIIESGGILATALLHEMDHLDGVLIIDFMSSIRRNRYKSWLKKELRRRNESGEEARYSNFDEFR